MWSWVDVGTLRSLVRFSDYSTSPSQPHQESHLWLFVRPSVFVSLSLRSIPRETLYLEVEYERICSGSCFLNELYSNNLFTYHCLHKVCPLPFLPYPHETDAVSLLWPDRRHLRPYNLSSLVLNLSIRTKMVDLWSLPCCLSLSSPRRSRSPTSRDLVPNNP